MEELKNEWRRQTNINFITIFTSMMYTLFKSKFVSNPLSFSAVHQESAV